MKKFTYLLLLVGLILGGTVSMKAQAGPDTQVMWTGDLLPPCLLPQLNWKGDNTIIPLNWGQSTTISNVYQSMSATTGPNTSPFQWFAIMDGESATMEFCCNGTKLIIDVTFTHNYLGKGTPQELLLGAELNIHVTHTSIPCDE